MTERWERLAPLTGVAAVVLWIVGVFVTESVSPEGDSPAEILAYFEEEGTTILVGAFLFALGTAFFVWFLGSLRAAFLAGEGVPGRVTAIAFAGGVGKAVCDLGVVGGGVAGAIAADEGELAPEAAQALSWVDDAFFVGAEFMALVLMAAAALIVLRTRVFPAWMGWLALLIAVGLLVVPVGWAFLLFGLPLWVLLASVLLFTRAPTGARTVPDV
jgi:hypothetical protein